MPAGHTHTFGGKDSTNVSQDMSFCYAPNVRRPQGKDIDMVTRETDNIEGYKTCVTVPLDLDRKNLK